MVFWCWKEAADKLGQLPHFLKEETETLRFSGHAVLLRSQLPCLITHQENTATFRGQARQGPSQRQGTGRHSFGLYLTREARKSTCLISLV